MIVKAWMIRKSCKTPSFNVRVPVVFSHCRLKKPIRTRLDGEAKRAILVVLRVSEPMKGGKGIF